MKEEKVKKTTKKASNTNKATKNVTVKKSVTKKSAQNKVSSEPKKRVKSTVSNQKLNISKETSFDNVVNEEKQDKYNRELLLRMILIIAYTLIIAMLLMGFIESVTKDLKIDTVNESYFVKTKAVDEKNILNINEAIYDLSKLKGDYFVYVTYTKKDNKELEIFERQLTNLIDKYDLKNNFYYINVDSILNEKNYIDLVNEYLGYNDVLIEKVPTIVYVNKDNIIRVENVLTRRDNQIINIGDFQNLLDINQFVAKK